MIRALDVHGLDGSARRNQRIVAYCFSACSSSRRCTGPCMKTSLPHISCGLGRGPYPCCRGKADQQRARGDGGYDVAGYAHLALISEFSSLGGNGKPPGTPFRPITVCPEALSGPWHARIALEQRLKGDKGKIFLKYAEESTFGPRRSERRGTIGPGRNPLTSQTAPRGADPRVSGVGDGCRSGGIAQSAYWTNRNPLVQGPTAPLTVHRSPSP